MKLSKVFSGLAITSMLCAGLASCSNELDPSSPEINGNMLVKAPKATAYAGNEKWNPFPLGFGSKGTRSGAGVTSESCQTQLIDWDHEQTVVEEYLPEKNQNLRPELDTDFLFLAEEDTSLEFYPVYSQTSQNHNLGIFYYDEEGKYYEEIVWENINPWGLSETQWIWDAEKMQSVPVTTTKGIRINIPAGYTFGFFWEGYNYNNYTRTRCYSDSSKNEETQQTDGEGNLLADEPTTKNRAVTFQVDGKTYLGIEDWTDFDFQDLVFTCDKELKTVDASTFVPGENPNPNPEPNPEPNPNPNPEPDPQTPDIQVPDDFDPGFTVTPETPAVSGEVEVNLALDRKEDGNVRSSHLSIHVRKATDVEIFIPVPRQYYCEADDMAIVMQHEPNHMGHGGPVEFTWTLKDSDLSVSLYVAYEDDGIRIWTDGITQEVIDWCYEKCDDGITFEVWNYFNDPDGNPLLSYEELRSYLDQASITFLDEVPDYYINAFADPNGKYDAEANPEGDDFHVRPTNGNNFDTPYEGTHFNNSDRNDIYKKRENTTPPPVPVY